MKTICILYFVSGQDIIWIWCIWFM